jgi:GNAT superfamily N-acetyltransferase
VRPPGLTIRPAATGDLGRILAIDPRRSDPNRQQRLIDALAGGECRVPEVSGDVLGYAVANASFYDYPFVWLVVVAEDARRRGVGAGLMQDALDRYPGRKVFTSTNESNGPSRAWIESLGFEPAGRIEHLDEGDPELMYVRLPSPG